MKRLFFIGIFALLIVATVFVWSKSFYAAHEEAYVQLKVETGNPLIPSEKGVFERSKFALDYANMPVDENHQRSLNEYYKNRAFHGAPPSIPHTVEEMNMGEKSCLKCHQNGGFVKKYNAFAPVAPHPQYVNCRQCHVPELTTSNFKGFNWGKVAAPAVGNSALNGSPPIIPHQIQLHENCLSCHAGPGAPKEIRVSHPERINCRQCHVLNNKETSDIGDYIR